MPTSGLALLLRKDNEVFDLARRGRRLPNILMAILAIFMIIVVSFVPFAVATDVIYGNEDALVEIWGGAFYLIAPFLLSIVSLGLWVRGYERRPFSTVGLEAQSRLKKYLVGLAIGFLMLAATIGMMALAGTVEFDPSADRPIGVGVVVGVMLMLAGFLVQGGAEEILWRGWLVQVLGARYVPWIGLLASSLLFAGLHGSTSIVANLNLVLFAAFLAFYYLYEGSIWGAMGWHATWNWAQASFFGITLSGAFETEHSLMNLRPTGSPLLSGGDFGPEASLFCTAVFLMGLVILALLSKRSAGRTR
jgi:membrane protease YdiL (CAAX protease family)